MEIFVPVMVSILLTLATIMAVVISMSKDKMWGITIKEWRELRREKLSFTIFLFSIIFISLAMLGVMVGYLYHNSKIEGNIPDCYLLCYWIFIWSLSLISLILAILYICKELPLLLRNEKIFERIYRKRLAYQNNIKINTVKSLKNKRTSENEEKFSTRLNTITEHLIFSKGVGKTLEIQVGKTKEQTYRAKCLFELLETQNKTLAKLSNKSSELIKFDAFGGVDDLNLSSIYDYAFNNLRWVLSFNENADITKLLGGDTYYQVTRTLFPLSKFDNGLFKDLQYNFKVIFTLCLYKVYLDADKDAEKIKFSNKILISCFAYALNDKKYKIFLDAIIDTMKEHTWIITSDEENGRVLFLIMSFFLYYLDEVSSYASEDTKKNVAYFLKEASGENFTYNSWKQNFQEVTPEILGAADKPAVLEKLLEYVEFVDRIMSRDGWSSIDTTFSEINVIDWYLETYVFCLWDRSFLDAITSNNSELKRKISLAIEQRWIGPKETLASGKKSYQGHENTWLKETMPLRKYYELPDASDFQDRIKDTLSCFINDVNSSDAIEAARQTIPETDESLSKKTRYLIETLRSIKFDINGKSNFGYDQNINLSKLSPLILSNLISLPLPKKGISHVGDLFEMHTKNFKNTILHHIREQIKQKIVKTLPLDKVASWVNTHKAKYSSADTYYIEMSKLELETIRSPILSPYLIWSDDAIRFNVEIDEEKTKVSRLTDEQISQIIQRDYTREDGRHVYNYSGIQIFLNREDLYKIVKTTHYTIKTVFKYDVVVDSKKVIRIER